MMNNNWYDLIMKNYLYNSFFIWLISYNNMI